MFGSPFPVQRARHGKAPRPSRAPIFAKYCYTREVLFPAK